MGLADVPFYGAYIERSQQNEAKPLRDLQQAQGALGLIKAVEEQDSSRQMKVLLAQSGGDAEKAIGIALSAGNIKAAHDLAPLYKIQQEQRQAAETRRGLQELNQAGTTTRPAALDPQEVQQAADQGTPLPAMDQNPESIRQQRIARLDAMSQLYANNPVMQANIQRQRAALESQKPMTQHDYPVAAPPGAEGPHIQPHISFDQGVTWQPVQGTVPTPKFAKQVAESRTGDALLGDDEVKFMAGQYLAGDRTVMQNLGRGQQGAENIVRLRREIAKQTIAQGGTPKDVAAAIGEFEGFKSGQRALGTRQAQIEMAANVTKQFAPLALEASNKFDRTDYKSLNDIEKAALERTSSPELRRFNFANTSLINAYARAVNPSGVATVSDKDHARAILDTGFSKGDYAAAVDQLLKEIDAELKAPGAVKGGMREFITANAGGGGEPAAAPSNPAMPDIQGAAKAAWGSFEPSKYEYRMSNGKVQRRAK